MKRIALLFFVSIIGVVAGYLILRMDLNAGSTGDMLVKTGKGLFYGFSALAIVFVLLMFVPSAFQAWKKFAIWFVPLAALLFAFYPNPGSGDFFSPYPEQIFQWVSALYVLVSALIIGWSIRKRRA